MKNVINTYSFNDYRLAFQTRLMSFKKSLSQDYNQQAMADHCRIQRTQLSKVLNGQMHMNEDQLYLSLKFLKYDKEEAQFLKLLHEYQRSSIRERKRELKAIIEDFKNVKVRTESVSQSKVNAPQEVEAVEYYLNPNIQLTHIFLTIPKFRHSPQLIRESLQIEEKEFQRILEKLLKMQLIAIEKDKINVIQEHVFLSWKSSLLGPYHTLAKVNAIKRLQSLPAEKARKLTVVISCTPKEAEEIQQKLISLYKEIEDLAVQATKPTDVYQFSYDFFPWTETE